MARAVLVGTYACTLAAALPFAVVLRNSLQTHLGGSLMADAAVTGVNWDWWQEFSGQATGLGTTFTPSVIGFAAVLDNLTAFLDHATPIPVSIILAAAAFALIWIFLWGGILDRYARGRPTQAYGFFSACGVFWLRFLRLYALAAILYWLLLDPGHEWLFGTAYARATRDVTSERLAFIWRVGAYAVFGLALGLVNMSFDYAKVRAVVEDRRSMIGALVAAVRFIARHPGKTSSLYLVNALLFTGMVVLYALAAPGAGGGGLEIWLAFIVGQLYILARLTMRLVFAASEVSLFQNCLAHAAYTAAPAAVWPDSPAVEAITNAARIK